MDGLDGPPWVLRGPPLAPSRLRAFEREMRRPFPPEYREFLLGVNGCVPTDEHRMVRLRTGATFLFVLFGFDAPRPWMDLERAIAEVRGWGYTTVPDQRIPIGRDSFDDHFWLETSGVFAGEVLFLPRADCPHCPPRRWITFEDFLSSLEPIPFA